MAAAPPAQWDSRIQGWIGPVKDQGQCGSCWCYSGTAVVEVAYYKAGLLKSDGSDALSEQYTLDCGRNGGCNGDDNVTVLEWAKATGLPKTSDYGPYSAASGTCKFKATQTLYKLDQWGFCDNAQGQGVTPPELIKAAIIQYGIAGVAIAADDAFMNVKPGDVFKGNSSGINHDVALVGWDDSRGSVSVCANPAGGKASTTAWILRNSWGDWCDKGYCLIEEGANLVGTEAVWAVINAAAPPIDFYV